MRQASSLDLTSADLKSSNLINGQVMRQSGATTGYKAEWARTYAKRPYEPAMKKQAVRSQASKPGAATTAVVTAEKFVRADTRAFLDTVGEGRFIGKYKTGESVYLQGDLADAVFYVQNGRVQITIVSEHGKEGVIAILGAGEFFGEGCLAGQPLHIATATVTEESTIVTIEKQAMIRVLRDKPALSHMFMSFLLSRNIRAEADFVDQLFNSSEKRLARMLLLLASVGKEGKTETIPKVSQEILAARVGTTRSRVNFFMNKFRRLGFIEYSNGPLKIHASLMNAMVHA